MFAPSDEAFAKLPAGTVETLLKPENKDQLTKVLTYHVVAGRWSAMEIAKMIKDGNGKAMLKTVAGGTLTATKEMLHALRADRGFSDVEVKHFTRLRNDAIANRLQNHQVRVVTEYSQLRYAWIDDKS